MELLVFVLDGKGVVIARHKKIYSEYNLFAFLGNFHLQFFQQICGKRKNENKDAFWTLRLLLSVSVYTNLKILDLELSLHQETFSLENNRTQNMVPLMLMRRSQIPSTACPAPPSASIGFS